MRFFSSGLMGSSLSKPVPGGRVLSRVRGGCGRGRRCQKRELPEQFGTRVHRYAEVPKLSLSHRIQLTRKEGVGEGGAHPHAARHKSLRPRRRPHQHWLLSFAAFSPVTPERNRWRVRRTPFGSSDSVEHGVVADRPQTLAQRAIFLRHEHVGLIKLSRHRVVTLS